MTSTAPDGDAHRRLWGTVVPVATTPPTDLRDTGRGLLLVEHLADRWDWHPRRDGPGKTVWAQYVVPTGCRPAAAAPSCPSPPATTVAL